MSRAIYVITGVMASGKSTVGELLSKRFERGVHLRGDIFRRMITSGRAEMTENATSEAREQLDMRYELAAMAACRYFDHGFDIHSLYQAFMDGTPRIGLWIDNSKLSPEQTVDRILLHSHL